MLGKIESRKRRERQRMRWLDGITDSIYKLPEFEQALGDGEGQGSLCAAVHVVAKCWMRLNNSVGGTEQQIA